MMNNTRLKIIDAYKEDVGRGIFRIDPDIIESLQFKTGDVIEIFHPITQKRTVALLYPGKNEDRGSKALRLGPSLRRNINASLDDVVEIRKIETALADRITFAGLKQTIIARNSQDLAKLLENRVVTKDDILSFYDPRTNRRIDLVVNDYTPKADAVRIYADTKILISDKTQQELIELEKQCVSYEDIGGLKGIIKKIRELIELPIEKYNFFKKVGQHPNTFLFYGKPGTGKTLLARVLKNEIKAHFIYIRAPEIMSKFYGQTEKNLKSLFEEAKKNVPSIIFIDHINALFRNIDDDDDFSDEGILAQICLLIDDIREEVGIFFIASSSYIQKMQPLLIEGGRFDELIHFPIPNQREVLEILRIHTKDLNLQDEVDLEMIAKKLDGYVGREIVNVIRKNIYYAIKESNDANILNDNPRITREHFEKAITIIKEEKLDEEM
jgi:transitional endoplasmic reticulum ATPase